MVEKSLVLTSFIALTNGQFVAPCIIIFSHSYICLTFGMTKTIMYRSFHWAFGCIFNTRIWMGGNRGIEVWFRRNVCIFPLHINLMATNFSLFSARPGRPPKRSPSIHASPETLEKLKKCRVDGDYPFDPRLYGKYISYHFIPANNAQSTPLKNELTAYCKNKRNKSSTIKRYCIHLKSVVQYLFVS